MKINLLIWIKAARLRTLPLSFSGIIAGSSLAYQNGTFKYDIFGFALLTTLLFQVFLISQMIMEMESRELIMRIELAPNAYFNQD